MGKYYAAIGILSVFIISVFIAGVIVVNPSSKRDSIMDKNRLDDFMKIKYQIDYYYQDNAKLPVSLEDISDANIKDPQTQKKYDYKADSQNNYSLCTTFSTDESKKSTSSYHDVVSNMYLLHKKGYDCITFNLWDNVSNSRRNIVPTINYYPNPRAVVPTTYNNSLSFLRVNSIPQGIQMTSTGANYAGTTPYVKSSNGQLSIRIDAPLNASMDGENYEFSAWSGCNNDTTADQFCTVLINESTVSITATYNKSNQELPQN